MNKRNREAAHAARKKKKIWPKLLLAGVLAVGLAAAAAAFAVKQEIGGRPEGAAVTVTIEPGSSVSSIAESLKQAGVIRFPLVFRWYVREQNAAGKLQYGTFALQQGQGYADLIDALSVYAAAETTRVTFPEGSTAIAIAQKMEQAGLCSAEEFLEEANFGDFSEFAFWDQVPQDDETPGRFMKCEGYLFPDTYEFLNDGTVHEYVATFYARFDQMMTEEIYASLEEQRMTLHELITLASFVQEEAGNDQDSNVAQVFRNRLAEGSPYPMLQSNASSYIQNDADNNYLWNWVAPYFGGWDEIPQEILSAYDTYSRTGLPAGPISNPGFAAIQAALHPNPSAEAEDAYFFVTDLTGHYYYAKTLTEHNANCQTAWAVNQAL